MNASMTNQDLPVSNPLVVLREEFDDWAVLFNPDTADAVGINPVGVSVWKQMDGKHSLEEIVQELKNCFSEVPDTVLPQVTEFVNKLAELGFVGYELKGSAR